MEMKKITNLANIKIKNYKFVILDIKKVRTNFKFRIILLKNGVIFLNVKRLHENWEIMFLDTGYRMLEKRVACAACRSSSIYKIDRIPR